MKVKTKKQKIKRLKVSKMFWYLFFQQFANAMKFVLGSPNRFARRKMNSFYFSSLVYL